MGTLPFIDAHIHLWDLAGPVRYPWLAPPFSDEGPNGSVAPIAHSYLIDDYLAESRGWNVVGAVHVDAGAEADDALAETRWLQGIADGRDLPLALFAFAALHAPGVEALLEAQAVHANVRGIRHIVNWHANPRRTYGPEDITLLPEWEKGFAALGRLGLSFDLQCYPGQMAHIAAIAARHPEVAVIVTHMGMPVLSDADGLGDWHCGMRALSELDQCAIKISGLGFIDLNWSPEAMRPLVLETIDLFGTGRIMFASDFPTDRLFADYDRCLGALDTITLGFSEDERRAMFAGNAARIYRLDIPGLEA